MPAHDLTTEQIPVVDLRTYHRNPRRGNTAVIAQSLTVNGQYKPVVVNAGTHTGRPGEVLAGNHTLMAAHGQGRVARLIELDPKYADVICRRYQEHTGTTPTRDGVAHDFTTD